MLLQTTGVPDNAAYLVLGFIAFAVIVVGWIVSLYYRMRSLRRERAMLAQMLAEDSLPERGNESSSGTRNAQQPT